VILPLLACHLSLRPVCILAHLGDGEDSHTAGQALATRAVGQPFRHAVPRLLDPCPASLGAMPTSLMRLSVYVFWFGEIGLLAAPDRHPGARRTVSSRRIDTDTGRLVWEESTLTPPRQVCTATARPAARPGCHDCGKIGPAVKPVLANKQVSVICTRPIQETGRSNRSVHSGDSGDLALLPLSARPSHSNPKERGLNAMGQTTRDIKIRCPHPNRSNCSMVSSHKLRKPPRQIFEPIP
jgi:hypothetical protein